MQEKEKERRITLCYSQMGRWKLYGTKEQVSKRLNDKDEKIKSI